MLVQINVVSVGSLKLVFTETNIFFSVRKGESVTSISCRNFDKMLRCIVPRHEFKHRLHTTFKVKVQICLFLVLLALGAVYHSVQQDESKVSEIYLTVNVLTIDG